MAQSRLQLLATINLGDEPGDDLVLALDLPTGFYNVAYVGALIASGGIQPYTYSISAGSLPTGLSLDTGTGEITGTPIVVGYFEFTATVTDSTPGTPLTESRTVAIRILSGIVFTQQFALGEEGIAYSSGISASGGTPPYTWTVASGSLPTSLSIDSGTGIVSGTPSASGTFNFTLTATDSAGNPQDFPTFITIADPVALAGTFPDGLVGVAYDFGPSLSGGVGPFSFSISSGSIPAGCSFSATSGAVFGIPTTAATYTFDITVLDGLGGTDTLSVSLDITAGGTGAGVASLNGADGVVTETSVDGSVGITNTPGANGNVDLSARLTANAATTTTLPANTYANGSSGVGATLTGNSNGALSAQDGVTLTANQTLLVKNEASGLKNGYYSLTQVGDVSHPYILTRSTRMDTTGEFGGAIVGVLSGTVNGGVLFVCKTALPTVGTTAIVFSGPAAVTIPKNGPGAGFTNGSLLIVGSPEPFQVEVPYAFSGTGWTIISKETGSASVLVEHATYSAYDTMSTLLTATITTAKKNQATGLTFSLAAGDIIRFTPSGISGFKSFSIQLDGTPS